MLDDTTRATGPIGVLVVDDEPQHRALCRLALEPHEHVEVVGEAHNGRRGIELAAELQPDVVVLDLRMPIMGGLEALPQIREVAPFARVVVWTAAPDGPMQRVSAQEAGAAAIVPKGVGLRELADVLIQLGSRRTTVV